MISQTYAVRWIEATGNGDIAHEELFDSLEQAQAWLDEAESPDDMGYLPQDTHFAHCGPRVIVPA